MIEHAFFLSLLVVTTGNILHAQQLVPNRSFEEVLQCPSDHSQLAGTAFWFDPTGISEGSPDYFHSCATASTHSTPLSVVGFQAPVDGEGYTGIYLYEGSQVLANWREYLQVELLEPLAADQCYHFIAHANLSDISSRTTNALGVRFYTEAVQLNNPYPPGDLPHLELPSGTFLNTDDWTPLEGTYIATGGERFLMIGNYLDNANTTVQQLSTNGSFVYALIDDVSLTPCTTTGMLEHARRPTLLIRGEELHFSDLPPGAHFRMVDPSGRLIALGPVQAGTITLPHVAFGMLILTVQVDGRSWHYKVALH